MQLTIVFYRFELNQFYVLLVNDKCHVEKAWSFVFARQIVEKLRQHDFLIEYDTRKTTFVDKRFYNRWLLPWCDIGVSLVRNWDAEKLLRNHVDLNLLRDIDWLDLIIVR